MIASYYPDGLMLEETYVFRPASIYSSGQLAYSSIRDVDPDAHPLEIRTHQGETLFIATTQRDQFRDAVLRAGLPIVKRVDVWRNLLEPFLLAEYPAEKQRRSTATLQSVGFSAAEINEFRRSLGSIMAAFNSRAQEATDTGLYYVLAAVRQPISWTGFKNLLFPKRYREFYWNAMKIAERGRTSTAQQW